MSGRTGASDLRFRIGRPGMDEGIQRRLSEIWSDGLMFRRGGGVLDCSLLGQGRLPHVGLLHHAGWGRKRGKGVTEV